MQVNINGFEAVEEGLKAAGVEKFLCRAVSEPLHNAAAAICRGSFFASCHKKTACLISEQDADALKYISYGRTACCAEDSRNGSSGSGSADGRKDTAYSGFEIIVLGRDLNGRFLENAGAYGLPVFTPGNTGDIVKMTADGIMYSELRRRAAVIYIPVRLLRSRHQTQLKGLYYCNDLYDSCKRERDGRTAALESRYNRIYSPGGRKYGSLIIGMPGCMDAVRDIISPEAEVNLCGMELIGAVSWRERVRGYGRILIIGNGSGYVKRMLEHIPGPEIYAAETGSDKLHEREETGKILKAHFAGRIIRSQDMDDGALLKVRKPTVEPVTDLMCTDCPYRIRIREIIHQTGYRLVYEDIYCDRYGTRVRSGAAAAVNAYACELVITNRGGDAYAGFNTVHIREECRRRQ